MQLASNLPIGHGEIPSTIKGGALFVDVNSIDRPFRIPGDIITGHVKLQMSRSFTITCIEVRLRCEEHAAVALKREDRQLYQDKRLRGRPIRRTRSVGKHDDDYQNWVDPDRSPRAVKRLVRHYSKSIMLFDGKAPFAKGEYQFPFEFRVPLSSPSHAPVTTSNGLKVGVIWSIKALVRRPGVFDLVKMKTVVPIDIQSVTGLLSNRSTNVTDGSWRSSSAASFEEDHNSVADVRPGETNPGEINRGETPDELRHGVLKTGELRPGELNTSEMNSASHPRNVLNRALSTDSDSTLPEYELRSLLSTRSIFVPDVEPHFEVSDMTVIKARAKNAFTGMFASRDTTDLILNLSCARNGIVQQPLHARLQLQASTTNANLGIWIRGLNVFLVQYCDVTIDRKKKDTYLYRHRLKSIPLSLRLNGSINLNSYVESVMVDKTFPIAFNTQLLKMWYAIRVELEVATDPSQKTHDVVSVESHVPLLSPVLCWYEGNGIALPPPPSPPPLDPLPPIPGVFTPPAVYTTADPIAETPLFANPVKFGESDSASELDEDQDEDDDSGLSRVVGMLLSGSYTSIIGISALIMTLAILTSLLIDFLF